MKIVFAASECAPYAKSGGLGDVVAGLSKELRHLGHDARIIMPLYGSIDRARYGITFEHPICVHMGRNEEQWIGLYRGMLDDQVPVWFVEYDRYFARPGLYHDASGEHGDNAFRFALLSKAVLQICKDKDFIPDVMHAHDWPTALVMAYLKTWDRILSPLSGTAGVLTIHNAGYQGVYHPAAYPYIGIGGEYFNPGCLESMGFINLLKGGIFFADAITTVSPTHAKELLEPIGGMGLAPYLGKRRDDFSGILNGVDYEHWNPATDPLIPARYDAGDLSGKAACKKALQQRFGLPVRDDFPIFGMVSRFAAQKGFDLMVEALPAALSNMFFQFVVLGTGDRHTEEFFRRLPGTHSATVGSHIGFSEELSHLIEAGSDFFVMPSLYEPCGLNQCYSMKYATIPVVRATGGLDDTVRNYDEATGQGTGFKFQAPTASALYYALGWAVSTWFDRPQHIAQMRLAGMAEDFSWPASARGYVEVYERAVRKKRGRG